MDRSSPHRAKQSAEPYFGLARWPVLSLLILASVIPLLWPSLPPLVDLPGHMARWHVSLDLHRSADLARYYDFAWHPVSNLGMDILVPALAFVLPFELAAKLGVVLIVILTIVGMLWCAREVHGTVPPTALLALPLAYAWPLQFGFVNFELGQAIALCALALWIRLGREENLVIRGVVALALGFILWISHSSAWAVFGLMAGGAEIGRQRQAGQPWSISLWRACCQCLPLLVAPLVLMPLAPPSSGLAADDWFDVSTKIIWFVSVLRDRWMPFDIASLLPILFAIYLGVRNSALGLNALLGIPAILCLIAFLLLPRLLMGGAYVDMRIIPITLVLGLLAIKPHRSSPMLGRWLLILGVLFFAGRTMATTVSFFERAHEQQHELAAIAKIPRGAAVLSLVSRPCNGLWSDLRRDHLPGMAVVRRDVFTNEQWQIGGQQLLKVRLTTASPYLKDPSQLVYPVSCHDVGSDFDGAIAKFPRRAFTHVWTIGFPPGTAKAADLQLIWTNGGSALYRVGPTS